MKPLIQLPQEHAEHLRAVGPLTALWFAVFTIPLLLWTHDAGRTGLSMGQATRRGWAQLRQTAREIRAHKNLALFLLSSMIYRDGLNTLFAVGGLYAAGTLHMDFQEILIFAIGLNVTSAVGAALFAFIDDALGSRRTVLISLAGLLAAGVAVLLTHDKAMFIALVLVLGIFIGPAQAASRTLAARLSPPGMINQTYGFYAFTGKCVSFLGPLAFGAATTLFHSQRAGMATILLFWLAGMLLLAKVKEEKPV